MFKLKQYRVTVSGLQLFQLFNHVIKCRTEAGPLYCELSVFALR